MRFDIATYGLSMSLLAAMHNCFKRFYVLKMMVYSCKFLQFSMIRYLQKFYLALAKLKLLIMQQLKGGKIEASEPQPPRLEKVLT